MSHTNLICNQTYAHICIPDPSSRYRHAHEPLIRTGAQRTII
jgi:hypothetical protein